MTPSTELPRDFCAGIGPLQLGVVLVSFILWVFLLLFQATSLDFALEQFFCFIFILFIPGLLTFLFICTLFVGLVSKQRLLFTFVIHFEQIHTFKDLHCL